MLFTVASALLVGRAVAAALVERQSCPNIHVFGARETTAPPGYGSSETVVNLVLNGYSGATAEAIDYPACGGQSSCGGASYSSSVRQGINSVASTVNSFNSRCPDTKLVLVGYSQGAEIMDVALCGGGDPNQGFTDKSVQLSSSAVSMVKAAILMGDPMWVDGLPYEVGTCQAGGFDARPSGFNCPSGSKIQSYCDAADPYCCNGNSQQTHQSYDTKYGQEAFAFIQSHLTSGNGGGNGGGNGNWGGDGDGGDGGDNGGGSGGTAAHWGQCGGKGYTGPTTCESPYTCKKFNDWYSQCL